MSLGNMDFIDFTPKASKTAKNLLQTTVEGNTKKETMLQLRISSDVFELFKEICESNHLTMSKAIRKYIDDVVSCGFGATPLERATEECHDKMS